MGPQMLGLGLEGLDQGGEGLVEARVVGEGDPVVGGDGLRHQAVFHGAVEQRKDPLVGGGGVGGLLAADRGLHRIRGDHEAEAVGLIDRGSDLSHPFGRGGDPLPVDPRLAAFAR